MQREDALDAFAVGNATDCECFVEPASFAANYDASKNLNALLVALHDARMNVNAIAHGKLRRIALLLFFFNSIDDAVHRVPPLAGEYFQTAAREMQIEML